MKNKKNIINSLTISILLFNTPINSMAYISEDSDVLSELFHKSNEMNKVDKNIEIKNGTVKEIALNSCEFASNKNKDIRFEEAEKYVKISEKTKTVTDIKFARYLVNNLPESLNKDKLSVRLNNISPKINAEGKNSTANLDVYIKANNMISLSLNTNNLSFDNYSSLKEGIKNTVTLTVNSSLPYKINVYTPIEIFKDKLPKILDSNVFKIKNSKDSSYKDFSRESRYITLLDDLEEGNGKVYNIDLLSENKTDGQDIYKTLVKFEAEQK